MDCPTDSMLTGLNVRYDAGTSNILQLQGLCQAVNSVQLAVTGLQPVMSSVTLSPAAGIPGGTLQVLTCPAGHVVTALNGRVGNSGTGPLVQVAVTCTRLFVGSTSDSNTAPLATAPNSISFSNNPPTCMNGAAVGISGHFSSAIERVQLRCR